MSDLLPENCVSAETVTATSSTSVPSNTAATTSSEENVVPNKDASESESKDKTNASSDGAAKKDDSMFECNICLDTAKEAVVSMCGHLFCWPCLHQWLETRPTRQLCPVCKASISKDKVIPLYGRGSSKEEDPRY